MSYQELFERLLCNRVEVIDRDSPVQPALMCLACSIDDGRSLDPDDVEIVCAAAVLVAGEDVSGLLEGEDINIYETETVKHCIDINRISSLGQPCISTIRLDFESKGHILTTLRSGWPREPFLVFDKIAPFVKRMPLDCEGLRLACSEASFSPAPICALCDEEYIGTLSLRLISINGSRLFSSFEIYVKRGFFEVIEDSCGVADSWSRLIDIAGIEKLASVDVIPLRMGDSVPPRQPSATLLILFARPVCRLTTLSIANREVVSLIAIQNAFCYALLKASKIVLPMIDRRSLRCRYKAR